MVRIIEREAAGKAVRLNVEHDLRQRLAPPVDGAHALLDDGTVMLVADVGADGVLRGRQRGSRLTFDLRRGCAGHLAGDGMERRRNLRRLHHPQRSRRRRQPGCRLTRGQQQRGDERPAHSRHIGSTLTTIGAKPAYL
ncbi:MAG: hypothetical protein U0703_24225 [Anaerolineae bacterium]